MRGDARILRFMVLVACFSAAPDSRVLAQPCSAHFLLLDRNRDGLLDYAEVIENATGQKRDWRHWFFYELDVNDDDHLSEMEYIDTPPSHAITLTRDFLRHDLDRSGDLTLSEFQYRRPATDHSLLARNFRVIDFDGNQRLSLGEFALAPGTKGRVSDRGPVPDPIVTLFQLELDSWRQQARRLVPDRSDVPQAVWSKLRWVGPSLGLATISFEEWDSNRDTFISDGEAESVFRQAFGLTNAAGDVIRRQNGISIDLRKFLTLDHDANGTLSLGEFVAGFSYANKENAESFSRWDLDNNGVLSFVEAAELPELQTNVVGKFLWWDTNLNGEIDEDDLRIRGNIQHRSMQQHLIAAFDIDHNQRLSFNEYRATPFLETSRDWGRAQDFSNDGVISWEEFFADEGPALAALARYFFDRFDLNHDQVLSPDEFSPQSRDSKVGARTVVDLFRSRDGNNDGSLSIEEFLRPIRDDRKAAARRNFGVADENGDGKLSVNEFRCLPGNVRFEDRGEVRDPIVEMMEQKLKRVEEVFRQSDTNRDGRISCRDWPMVEMSAVSAELISIPPSIWDVNKDGDVTTEECRNILEVSFGIRRIDGSLLRLPNGCVVNLVAFLRIDKDKNGLLSQSEFVADFRKQPPENLKIFALRDLNNDNQLDWSEILQIPEMLNDSLALFFKCDTNLDGFVDMQELSEPQNFDPMMATRLKRLGSRLMAAFSQTGDRLSFQEFRAATIVNPVADWYRLKKDADNDGLLSWAEFYDLPPPQFIGLYREYFNRFDQNDDEKLSFDELEFSVDRDRLAPDTLFRVRDVDHDGKLTLKELFTESKPNVADVVASERYEMRLEAATGRFRADDTDGDNSLSFEEFQQSRDTALGQRGKQAKKTRRFPGISMSNFPLIAMTIIGLQALMGMGWYFFLRRSPHDPS
eukprot:TRINITY_DN65_c0_g2_i1.p1 TRINITY_DN65_c0_g2~~TRINITY_DN65_c0_g2_i1.p1  ORF type:complete len:920 (-),score=157.24 TRINITY_DN65_c0_g2_i1:15624-18383(-)